MSVIYIVKYITPFENTDIAVFKEYSEAIKLIDKISSHWPVSTVKGHTYCEYNERRVYISQTLFHEKAENSNWYNIRQIF